MSSPRDGLAEQHGLPSVGGRRPVEHLHGRGLAAAVRAEKAEDLALLDAEADMIHRGEFAESLGEPLGFDRGVPPFGFRGGITSSLWPWRSSSGKSAMNAASRSAVLPRSSFPSASPSRSPGRRPWRRASRTAPPRPCRRSRRSRSFRGRRARMRSISSQNCRRDSGSTPVVGSSRISRSGSWISEQQSDSFCFMPPESLPAGRARNGSRPVERVRSPMRAFRSASPWPNSRPMKSRFSNTLSVG